MYIFMDLVTMPWWRGLVVSSPPDTEKTGAVGREIESRVVGSLKTIQICTKPWRRGAMDIASASGTKRPGFESHQDIRFL
jgi:hypothetical protein